MSVWCRERKQNNHNKFSPVIRHLTSLLQYELIKRDGVGPSTLMCLEAMETVVSHLATWCTYLTAKTTTWHLNWQLTRNIPTLLSNTQTLMRTFIQAVEWFSSSWGRIHTNLDENWNKNRKRIKKFSATLSFFMSGFLPSPLKYPAGVFTFLHSGEHFQKDSKKRRF